MANASLDREQRDEDWRRATSKPYHYLRLIPERQWTATNGCLSSQVTLFDRYFCTVSVHLRPHMVCSVAPKIARRL